MFLEFLALSLARCLKVSSLTMRSWLLLRSSLSSQRVRENMEEERLRSP